MKRIALTLSILLLLPFLSFAGNDSSANEAPVARKQEIVKTGWNLGMLPAFNYDTELGFMSGALGQIYHYGDGTMYPNYRHKIKVLACVYSKGSKQVSLDYDTKYLLPGKRVTALFDYMDNPLTDFFGFNGAVSPYYAQLDQYIPENGGSGIAFYSDHMKRLRTSLDLQGKLAKNLTWLGGFSYSYQQYSDISLKSYEGTETLFRQYVASGLIPEEDLYGHRAELKGGLVYDSRDLESNPSRGLYASAAMKAGVSYSTAAKASLMLALDLRQYVPLVPGRLTFAYQLAYEGLVAGSLPFYALPDYTVRGVLGNRITGTGSGVAWASADLRWNMASFRAFKQNFLIGLMGFADAGAVVQSYKLEEQMRLGNYTVSGYRSIFDSETSAKERVHASTGGGVYFSMNSNFVCTIQLAKPFNVLDGKVTALFKVGFSF